MLVTDVIGHKFANAQLLADQFAANGYLTVMPDIFAGDPVPMPRPDGFDLQAWLAGQRRGGTPHDAAHTEPYVTAAVKYLREQHGCAKVGSVGYCFGAKYTVRGLGVTGGIDVGYVAHPSFVGEDELEAVKGPLSVAAAQTDEIFTAEKRHASEGLLAKAGQPWQINLYSGAEHGFAVRGDVSKKAVKFAKEQAFCQAIVWFDTWLKQ